MFTSDRFPSSVPAAVRFPAKLYGQPIEERRRAIRRDRRPLLIGGVLATAILSCGGAIAASAGSVHTPATIVGMPADTSPPVLPTHISTPRHRMRAWMTGGGAGFLAQISADLGADDTAAGKGDYAATRAACQQLSRDVAAATAYAPIPSLPIQQAWASALGHFGAAATACVNGVNQRSDAQLSRAADELSAGAVDAATVGAAMSGYEK